MLRNVTEEGVWKMENWCYVFDERPLITNTVVKAENLSQIFGATFSGRTISW